MLRSEACVDNTLMIFDTETTGIPSFRIPSDDPTQPHLVELAMGEFTVPDLTPIWTYSRLVKPDGWTIPDEVAAIHGITTAIALADGEPLREVVSQWWKLASKCRYHLAFNANFDKRIMRIACLRCGASRDHIENMESKRILLDPIGICTSICQIPPTERMNAAGFRKPKTPKLSEAYQIIVGKPMADAHQALGDITATREIVLELIKRQKFAFPEFK